MVANALTVINIVTIFLVVAVLVVMAVCYFKNRRRQKLRQQDKPDVQQLELEEVSSVPGKQTGGLSSCDVTTKPEQTAPCGNILQPDALHDVIEGATSDPANHEP